MSDLTPGPEPARRTAAGRVLALLGAFAEGGSLTLSELSRNADLSLTTTHRLVKEVLAWGGLEVDDAGRYRLSNKILELASNSTRAFQLRERALPHLIELHQQTGLSVQLGTREDDNVMYLEALRVHPDYSGQNRIGGQLPLHATASGLVLLAYSNEDSLDHYLSQPLRRYTAHTVTDPVELRAGLADVRRRRYAIASQTIAPEAGSVAAPIIGADLTVTATVSVIFYPANQEPEQLVRPVLVTANRISKAISEASTAPDPRTIDYNRRRAGLL